MRVSSISIILFIAFFLIGTAPLLTGTVLQSQGARSKFVVMPFKVELNGEKTLPWLGRAVSYYVTAGLEKTGVPVLSDNETVSLLETYAVRFPYSMTKATVLHLAGEAQQEQVIWGEIVSDPEERSQLTIRAFIVDLSVNPDTGLKNFRQSYLPVLKGSIDDLYQVLEELLVSVHKGITTEPVGRPGIPGFKLNHRNYEIFIESLLLTDPAKRLALLEKARKTDADSDDLNFQLAKAYFDTRQYKRSKELLEKVKGFVHRKNFLGGLLNYRGKNITAAVETFKKLLQEKQYLFETCHNLGIIYAGRKSYKQSEEMFSAALKLRNDPLTGLYRVHQLIALNRSEEAAASLKEVIRNYPDIKSLERMFSFILSRSPDRNILFMLFREYIPDLEETEELPDAALSATSGLQLKSPFNVEFHHSFSPGNEFSDIRAGYRAVVKSKRGSAGVLDISIELLQSLMAVNPYIADYYRFMSVLQLRKKETGAALANALAAVFLMPDEQNQKNLEAVRKAAKKIDKKLSKKRNKKSKEN